MPPSNVMSIATTSASSYGITTQFLLFQKSEITYNTALQGDGGGLAIRGGIPIYNFNTGPAFKTAHEVRYPVSTVTTSNPIQIMGEDR